MRHDVYHYFQQACRREAQCPTPQRWVSAEDATAGFSLQIGEDGTIQAVGYRCTTCMTLVALCEHVAEKLCGATVSELQHLSAGELLAWHPEVPPTRRSRANLAVAAAQAALENTHQ
jgi:NifU-like protein involved in Fe-S cluster formation